MDLLYGHFLLVYIKIGAERMMKFISLITLVACSQVDYDNIDTGDIEEVVCSHPSSQFEAQIEINYPDNDFLSVEFVLGQNEEFWVVDLLRPNEAISTWHTTMQILEFDCNTDFTYDFIVQENEE
jgi:hypothetical protein